MPTELPEATEVNDDDVTLIKQGAYDKQVFMGLFAPTRLDATLNLADVPNKTAARQALSVPQTSSVLLKSDNLASVGSKSQARQNLGVAKTSDTLLIANALSELIDKAQSRTNIGVKSIAETLLKANNLADLSNPVAARLALGISGDADALLVGNALSDLSNVAIARQNLSISSNAETLLRSNNLAELPSKATSRSNLSVPAAGDVLLTAANLADTLDAGAVRSNLSMPTAASGLVPSLNLSDLPSKSTARINLGVPLNTTVLLKDANLSDVTASNARTNLGLRNLATQNAGDGFGNSGTDTNLDYTALTETTSLGTEPRNSLVSTLATPTQTPAGTLRKNGLNAFSRQVVKTQKSVSTISNLGSPATAMVNSSGLGILFRGTLDTTKSYIIHCYGIKSSNATNASTELLTFKFGYWNGSSNTQISANYYWSVIWGINPVGATTGGSGGTTEVPFWGSIGASPSYLSYSGALTSGGVPVVKNIPAFTFHVTRQFTVGSEKVRYFMGTGHNIYLTGSAVYPDPFVMSGRVTTTSLAGINSIEFYLPSPLELSGKFFVEQI